MLLCASPDYLRRRSGEPITMDALSRHQAVGYLHAGAVLPWQLRGENGELQPFRPPAKMMMDDMQGIVDAVSAVPVLPGCRSGWYAIGWRRDVGGDHAR